MNAVLQLAVATSPKTASPESGLHAGGNESKSENANSKQVATAGRCHQVFIGRVINMP
jgi:hypothetical protein